MLIDGKGFETFSTFSGQNDMLGGLIDTLSSYFGRPVHFPVMYKVLKSTRNLL